MLEDKAGDISPARESEDIKKTMSSQVQVLELPSKDNVKAVGPRVWVIRRELCVEHIGLEVLTPKFLSVAIYASLKLIFNGLFIYLKGQVTKRNGEIYYLSFGSLSK